MQEQEELQMAIAISMSEAETPPPKAQPAAAQGRVLTPEGKKVPNASPSGARPDSPEVRAKRRDSCGSGVVKRRRSTRIPGTWSLRQPA